MYVCMYGWMYIQWSPKVPSWGLPRLPVQTPAVFYSFYLFVLFIVILCHSITFLYIKAAIPQDVHINTHVQYLILLLLRRNSEGTAQRCQSRSADGRPAAKTLSSWNQARPPKKATVTPCSMGHTRATPKL